eukprot:CAMPEP_0175424860 /NCGR_PEP_ID=MMETSP0095-20121207/48997_1 /TAXON_ID=311494 /ORGANISM="Alexandrium monilatum, Strain CCMP3105" /LENGTH=213 /DNA_ID=CAMNT_0016724165 /DNA_START=30 /DNA_END=672 /DNA_ORIENTATION=+
MRWLEDWDVTGEPAYDLRHSMRNTMQQTPTDLDTLPRSRPSACAPAILSQGTRDQHSHRAPGPRPGALRAAPPRGAACAAHLPSGGVRTTAGAPSSPLRQRLVVGVLIGCAFDPGDHLRDSHVRLFFRIEIDRTGVLVIIDPERAMAGVEHDGAVVRSVGQVACRGDGVGAACTTAVAGQKVLGPRVDAVSVDAIGAHHMHPLGLKLVSCRSA